MAVGEKGSSQSKLFTLTSPLNSPYQQFFDDLIAVTFSQDYLITVSTTYQGGKYLVGWDKNNGALLWQWWVEKESSLPVVLTTSEKQLSNQVAISQKNETQIFDLAPIALFNRPTLLLQAYTQTIESYVQTVSEVGMRNYNNFAAFLYGLKSGVSYEIDDVKSTESVIFNSLNIEIQKYIRELIPGRPEKKR